MKLVAFDGHDGSGKTCTARDVVSRLEGAIYIKPFDGLLGDYIAWLHSQGKYEQVNTTAQLAMDFALSKVDRQACEYAVLDRGWLSIFTIIPESCWSSWMHRVNTILFWCCEKTTIARLNERGEEEGVFSNHEFYCKQYKDLALRFNVPIIDTGKMDYNSSLEKALDLVKNFS